MEKLPDILQSNLKIVFCGTAAGRKSAVVGAYYAGPGNKFWRTLHQIGLTPIQLSPSQFARVLEFDIGLTDISKFESGPDADLSKHGFDRGALAEKIERYQPEVLCFNGKRAAQEYFGRKNVSYGLQNEKIGSTRLYIAPSTSGAASGFWDIKFWEELGRMKEEGDNR